jgi:hypothetical protein
MATLNIIASLSGPAAAHVAALRPATQGGDGAKPTLERVVQTYVALKQTGAAQAQVTSSALVLGLLSERGTVALQKFMSIYNEAFATSTHRNRTPTQIPANVEAKIQTLPEATQQHDARVAWPHNDGHIDAFRHAYCNARLACEFGGAWAEQFATAHEGNDPGNAKTGGMDLYNNHAGCRIGLANPNASPAQLADLVKGALERGELVVIDRSGELNWSNQVPIGHHGVPIPYMNIPIERGAWLCPIGCNLRKGGQCNTALSCPLVAILGAEGLETCQVPRIGAAEAI